MAPAETGLAAWTRYSTALPYAAERPLDHVEIGPALPRLDRRLIGDVTNKRVLDLGCGAGHAVVALARQGAKVIGIDTDAGQLAHARELCERHEVRAELHHGDLADLAFIPSASIDVALAVFSLAAVADLDRVFRQVHRLLQPEAPLLLTLPHPFAVLVEPVHDGGLRVIRKASGRAPLGVGPMLTYPHQISSLHTSLVRANFRVDTILEPEPVTAGPKLWRTPLGGWLPSTLVVRARKLGV